MSYEFKVDKKGNRRFARLSTTRVRSVPKGAVTIEPAKPTTVAKVDIDTGEVEAVAPVVAVETASVPTTPKKKSSG